MPPAPIATRSPRLPHAIGALLAMASLGATTAAQTPFPGTLPGIAIDGGLPLFFEPSGAAWHPRLDRLFVVSDDGRLTRMNASGGALTTWTLGGDLEGVCVADPASDFVYVGLEFPEAVLEFDFVAGVVTRSFDLSTDMPGNAAEGLEALTFARDPSLPEGGLFYAGSQLDGRIYEFELTIASSAVLTGVNPGVVLDPAPLLDDLAGLDWVAATDTLYAVFDTADEVFALDRAGTVNGWWDLPGSNQEGIAIRGCRLFVPQDSGELLRYEGFPDPTDCDELTIDTPRISLAAGGTQTLSIDFGAPLAGVSYLVVGSRTDTLPGFSVGATLIPLEVDSYFQFTFQFPGSGPLGSTLGVLDASGQASATFTLAPGTSPALAGTILWHCAVPFGPAPLDASNPTALTLLP